VLPLVEVACARLGDVMHTRALHLLGGLGVQISAFIQPASIFRNQSFRVNFLFLVDDVQQVLEDDLVSATIV